MVVDLFLVFAGYKNAVMRGSVLSHNTVINLSWTGARVFLSTFKMRNSSEGQFILYSLFFLSLIHTQTQTHILPLSKILASHIVYDRVVTL